MPAVTPLPAAAVYLLSLFVNSVHQVQELKSTFEALTAGGRNVSNRHSMLVSNPAMFWGPLLPK